jgi:hypothetical protein
LKAITNQKRKVYQLQGSRDSSIGTTTRYELEGSVIHPGGGEISAPVQTFFDLCLKANTNQKL